MKSSTLASVPRWMKKRNSGVHMSTLPGLDGLDFPPSREDVQRTMDALGEHNVSLVHLQFSDIAGGGRTVTIPTSLLPKVFRRGFRFDGAAVSGGMRQVEVDLFLAPDPGTLVILPAIPDQPRRAQLFCWVTRKESQPFAGDPRTILQRQLQRAAKLGLDYRVGIELEFREAPYQLEAARVGQGEDPCADERGEDEEDAVRKHRAAAQ